MSNLSCHIWSNKPISLRNFASFVTVTVHNSCVNFKFIHLLLWIKVSHQSLNFQTFEYSGETLPNSSCDSPNHKSVFLQILHHSSTTEWCNITPLYFFRSNVMYFAQKKPIKVQILETFECSCQNSPKFCHCWNNKSVFLQILRYFSVSWDISSLYSFS